MHPNLNPSFEILGLLHMHYNPALLEAPNITKQANELNINPEELHKKFTPLLKRYISAFEKKLVTKEGDSTFLGDAECPLTYFLQILLAEVPEWTQNIESAPEPQILATIKVGLSQWLLTEIKEDASVNEIIETLKTSELPPSTCWKVVLLLQEPKLHIQHLVEIIRRNTPAYQYAIQAIEKPLTRQLEKFQKQQQSSQQRETRQRLLKDAGILDTPHTVTPTLIHPTFDAITQDTRYAGLFIDDFYQMIEGQKKTPGGSNPVIKALSDSSKYDILLSLHNAPKYNLELAEHLNLTPATITHHMQALLLHGLVSVEKRDGRVYYTLQRGMIKMAVEQLQETFSI